LAQSNPGEPKDPDSEDQPAETSPQTADANPRERARRAVTLGVAATAIGGLGGSTTPQPQGAPTEPERQVEDEPEPTGAYRVSSDWDINPTRNEEVDFFIEFLQWKNRDKTKLWLERLGKYGPMIQQKLAERGMPQDLLWLATIESGLNPNAYSRAAAAGLWQFIEETGERHGLEVSEYVDERRDPLAATDAALDYLAKLNRRFGGSWYLSAAAYNTGENRVERVVREKAGGRLDDAVFWEVASALPSETRDYVPLMLAMGHIAKDPHKYGFTDLELQMPLAFEEVRVPGRVPLSRVAEIIGVPAETVYELNPHLVKKTTPPGREWSVRVPEGKAQVFNAQ
jgi:membrane-bound lytic murein transglycosylase D